MSRVKKPENETPEEMEVRQTLELISNAPTRSEKTSWNRKMDNMVKLIAKVSPIEQQILELMAAKLPIMDDVSELRNMMVKECVHPYEYLLLKEDHIACKFCNCKITTPK